VVDPHHPGDREGRVSAFAKAVPPFAPTEAVISPSLRLPVSAREGKAIMFSFALTGRRKCLIRRSLVSAKGAGDRYAKAAAFIEKRGGRAGDGN